MNDNLFVMHSEILFDARGKLVHRLPNQTTEPKKKQNIYQLVDFEYHWF